MIDDYTANLAIEGVTSSTEPNVALSAKHYGNALELDCRKRSETLARRRAQATQRSRRLASSSIVSAAIPVTLPPGRLDSQQGRFAPDRTQP